MQPNLVRSDIDRRMEGSIMGELFIQKPNGESITYQIDGTVIKEQSEISINWCDKCEKWKPKEFGRYDGAQGLTMLWVCMECK